MSKQDSNGSTVEAIDSLSGLRRMAIQVIKGVLPYPDLPRRWKVRACSRSLIRFNPWPGNDATQLELAQLCLLRSLSLQKQIHRSVRWRHREGAALLARSTIENTILGLWCLYSEEPMDRLCQGIGKAMNDSMRYLVEGDELKAALVDILVEEVGGARPLPKLWKIAKEVSDKAESSLTTDLYRRLYTPLSSFFSHANGSVLMRHVKPNGSPKFRPSYPWNRRGPVRAADACMGVMALAISNRTEDSTNDSELFERYATCHMSRTLAPLPIMAGRNSRRVVKWTRIPTSLKRLQDGVRYFHSDQGIADSWEVREARVHSDVAEVMKVFLNESTENVFPKMVDILVRMVVGSSSGQVEVTDDEVV